MRDWGDPGAPARTHLGPHDASFVPPSGMARPGRGGTMRSPPTPCPGAARRLPGPSLFVVSARRGPRAAQLLLGAGRGWPFKNCPPRPGNGTNPTFDSQHSARRGRARARGRRGNSRERARRSSAPRARRQPITSRSGARDSSAAILTTQKKKNLNLLLLAPTFALKGTAALVQARGGARHADKDGDPRVGRRPRPRLPAGPAHAPLPPAEPQPARTYCVMVPPPGGRTRRA